MPHNDTGAVLIEPVAAPDIFATGMTAVEDFGSYVRVVLYADKRSATGSTVSEFLAAPIERHVVARVTMPKDQFMACSRLAAEWVEASTHNRPTLVVSNGH